MLNFLSELSNVHEKEINNFINNWIMQGIDVFLVTYIQIYIVSNINFSLQS